MRSSEASPVYPTTRIERSQKLRRERHRKLLFRSSAITFVSVSLTSFCALRMVGSTEALLISRSTPLSVSFSAADHFPGWYAQQEEQIQSYAGEAGDFPHRMKRLTELMIRCKDAGQMKGILGQINADAVDEASIVQEFHTSMEVLVQAATEDEGNYSLAVQEKDGNSDIDSLARVAQWGQNALRTVSSSATVVDQDASLSTSCVSHANSIYQRFQAALAAESTAIIAANSSMSSANIYAPQTTVLNSVYETPASPALTVPLSVYNAPPANGNESVDTVLGNVYGQQ